jgi:predicted metal-dependent hydrolase
MTIPSSERLAKGEMQASDRVERGYRRGLALAREGRYFEAHEALEDAWRAASPEERDFFQGLVHLVVAWYQAGRRNRVGCERQLEKAARRLTPFAPAHRGIDVAGLLAQAEAARCRFPALPPLVIRSASPGRGSPAPG